MKNKSIWAKTEIWEVPVSESVLDMVHGNIRTIMEVHIPKYNISFNVVDGNVHIFRTDNRYKNFNVKMKPRKTTFKVKILEHTAKTIDSYLLLKEQIENEIKEFWNSIKK